MHLDAASREQRLSALDSTLLLNKKKLIYHQIHCSKLHVMNTPYDYDFLFS